MLLPSAFLCEGPPRSRNTTHHTRAQSMTSPPASPAHRRSTSITSDIYTSCRALQSRLSANLSQSQLRTSRAPTLLPSPAFTAGASTLRPKERKPKPAQTHSQTPPRGAKKRRRSISDDEGRECAEEEAGNGPSTPKRQRFAPPSIPLGLSPGDFERLERAAQSPSPPSQSPETAVPARPKAPQSPAIPLQSANAVTARPKAPKRSARPSLTIATITPNTYPSSLVSLIVQKLSLSEQDQRGLDSKAESNIDERWRMLLSEAEMARGLKVRREMVIRRGRRERMSLGVLDGVWFAGRD